MGKTFNTGTLVNGLFTDANGNVGINTTSPSYKLDVNGTGRFSDLLNVTTGSNTKALSLNGASTGYQYMEMVNTGASLNIGIASSTGAFWGSGGGGNYYSAIGTSNATDFVIGTNNIGRFFITSSGNIGIGGLPNEKLSITGPNGIAGMARWTDATTGSAFLGITSTGTPYIHSNTGTLSLGASGSNNYSATMTLSSGYVGIGTTSPVSPLEVVGNNNWTGGWRYALTVTSNDYPTIRLKAATSGKISWIGNNGDGSLYFNVNASESSSNIWAMVLSPSGNVSVGSTADIGTRLQVNGANYVEMATFAAAATASNIVSDNAGYLSMQTRFNSNSAVFQINTSAPYYGIKILKAGLLHVNFIQDVTSAGTTGYVAGYIRLNGSNIAEGLITNTGSQWDGISNSVTLAVAANDIISFYFNASDITSFDQGTWSQYNFIWTSR